MVELIVLCTVFQFLVFKRNQKRSLNLKTISFVGQPSDKTEKKKNSQGKKVTKTYKAVLLLTDTRICESVIAQFSVTVKTHRRLFLGIFLLPP